MPTVIGVLFLLAGAVCWFLGEQWLLALLMVSSFFEAASVINFGQSGIQPYYLIACFLIASQLRKPAFWKAEIDFKGKIPLILFGIVGVVSAVTLPFLFAGTPVLSPTAGIDVGLFYQPPLQFGMGNAAQAVYLLIDLLALFSAGLVVARQQTRRSYDAIYSLLLLFLFIQFALLSFGIEIPREWFQNNPGYAIARMADTSHRVMGTFTEPSEAGLVLVMFFAGAFYDFFVDGKRAWAFLATAAALGLVRSTAALASMAVIVVLICAVYPFYQFPWTLRTGRTIKVIGLIAIAALLVASPLGLQLAEFTVDKGDTGSYISRTAADIFALHLTYNTHFLGVGLGSNRPSSLFTSLLSNLGILGTVLFMAVVVRVAQNARGPNTWLRWAIAGGVLDMCFGVPDITQPILWIYLGLATYYGACQLSEGESLTSARKVPS